jgi:hypothetical protein
MLYFFKLAIYMGMPYIVRTSALPAFLACPDSFGSFMQRVLSANRLRDGVIVYLGPYGDWVTRIEDAALFTTEAASEAATGRARHALAANEIVDPIMVEVTQDGDERRATTLRNAIRALGPTVNFKGSAPAA